MELRDKFTNFEPQIYNAKIKMMSTLTLIPLFLGNIRGWEWLIILLVVLLLFGGKKIPELMKGVGKGISSFKEGLNEAKKEINKAADENSSNEEKK